MNIQQDLYFMDLALQQAQNARGAQEVPVGALIINETGQEIARQFNLKEALFDPTAHAEILCLREAGEKLKNWRLENCTMYVTLEPCPMCMAALWQARIKRLVFGTYDPKSGAISLGFSLHQNNKLNHRFSVTGGIRHFETGQILSSFFKEKRTTYQAHKKSHS